MSVRPNLPPGAAPGAMRDLAEPARSFEPPRPGEAPTEAKARPTADDVAAAAASVAAVEDEVNQYLADARDAACLNALMTAMRQAHVEDWTPELVARWRAMRAQAEAAACGGEGEVASAFGPLVRTAQGAKIAALAAEAARKLAAGAAPREPNAARSLGDEGSRESADA